MGNSGDHIPTALLLFSHGSLLCGAGETLRGHAERLRASGAWCAVETGYLNYSEPMFEDAVELCVDAGARRVIVVPYFLVAGKFVTTDLPPRVAAARAAHPGVGFALAEPLGYDDSLVDALIELAADARTPERWRDDLLGAPAFCTGNRECPLYGTARCPVFLAESPSP
jgi:sirohydrochlorin cobaltochelatase